MDNKDKDMLEFMFTMLLKSLRVLYESNHNNDFMTLEHVITKTLHSVLFI